MSKRYSVGDTVTVNKDITRIEGLYATKGERGIILEIFHATSAGAYRERRLFAKVKMAVDGRIKTFRLTSLALEGR
jgi:hypothetical protein